ncbi:MAG: hypothetical protein R3336_01725 [Phycisphaeraceae bacterium]|nr:hypothetical protein [Phycisphaeraceae bacterium]
MNEETTPDTPTGLFTPGQWLIAVVTALYMLIATPWAWVTGNGEFLFYVLVMLLLIVAVVAFHLKVRLSTGALACLSAWGLSHMAGGLMPVPESWPINGETHVLYSLWLVEGHLKYDHVVHAFGFGVTTWICWQGLASSIAGGPDRRAVFPTLGRLTLCAAAGLGFGAMNEIVEFIATLTMPETNVGGYINTGWDLVANTVGAVIAAVIIRLGYRPTD